MPSAARNLANLLGGSATIPQEKLGNDISTIEQVSSTDALTAIGNTVGDQRVVGNNLYIWNGTGWYRIALINTTPTWDSGGQPAGAYELSSDSPQTATTITLAASDPEGLSIDYSYVTSGSMDSMATISQDSSVFTITPKTLAQMGGAGNEGPHTGSITFRASDGVNILPQVSSFTLKFITMIENSKYTIMHVNAIAASDNNNITDTSTNNHTITVNGDAHAGTFSPYRSGGYSTYFDGNGDWLTLTGTALGNGNFTVEAWVWLDSLKDYNLIYDDRATGSSATGLALGVDSTGAPYLYTNNGFQITSSQTCTAKTWHHISLVRNSGVITIYLDGTSGGTYSSSANFTDTNLGIGVARTYTVTSQFGGYISDVRAVVGSAITPSSGGPTERLTAVTNTSLLTCHLPYIADGSSNAHSITVNGNVSTKPFSPYDYLEYSAADNGGSVYFDGNGDVIYTSQDTAFNFGTADFTFEAWVYPTLYTSDWDTLFAIGNSTNNGGLLVGKSNAGSFVIRQYGTANVVSTTTLPNLNTWTHIACVRSSGTSKLYYNGSEIATASDTTNYSSTTPFAHIGNSDHTSYSHYWNGYVSDARFISGTAVYSGAFTPPTAPLSSTGTELHIKGTDASIIDTAQSTHIRCVGSAAGTSSPVKFPGTHSLSLPGFGHWMPSPMTNGARLSGTEDWTVEAWVYPTSRQSYSVVVSCGSSFALALGMVSGNFHVYNNSAGGFTDTDVNYGTYDIPANQWTHLAATRVSGNWYCYVDGTLRYQKTGGSWQSHVMNETTQYTIGALDGYASFSGNERWYGNIQDVRITKGLARYTANFTPPTAPLEG